MSSLDWLHNTELISQHVHEAIEATIFPSLSILFLGGEQDGLSKTLLVVSFDKSCVQSHRVLLLHMDLVSWYLPNWDTNKRTWKI